MHRLILVGLYIYLCWIPGGFAAVLTQWPTPESVDQKILQWKAHPEVQSSVLGYSHQGRPIHLLSIGAEKAPHEVLWVCGQHGDEPDGVQACLSLIERVLSGIQEPAWQQRWPQTRWHVVPLLNPDGRQHNTRKNAAAVNLNANWAYGWFEAVHPALRQRLYASQGVNYRGDAPFSEPETQALSRWIAAQSPDLVVDYHTGVAGFSQGMVLYPFTKDAENTLPAVQASAFKALAERTAQQLYVPGDTRDPVMALQTPEVLPYLKQAMLKHVPAQYLQQALAQLPPSMQSPGSSIDWCWGAQGIPALGLEISLPIDVSDPNALKRFQQVYAAGYGDALLRLLADQLDTVSSLQTL